MENQKATNVTWHDGEVAREDRQKLLKQKGATVWFTGLSGSGKSTVAVAVEKVLHDAGHLTYRLDGDNIRLGINRNLGFSAEDRTENVRRIGEIAKLFTDVGVIVLTSFISPYRADRDMVRELHESAGMEFFEIHIDVPLAEAEKRDPKGLYKKAREGKIKQFTGIDAPYETPAHPELVLHTDHLSVEAEAAQVIDLLKSRGIL